MKDIMIEMQKAKQLNIKWNRDMIEPIASLFDRKEKDAHTNYRDILYTGTEWVHFLSKTEHIAMVHIKLPICFLLKKYEEYKSEYFSDIHTVLLNSFYTEEWFLDLKKLEREVPEITWSCAEHEFDTTMFSTDDFKFATEA